MMLQNCANLMVQSILLFADTTSTDTDTNIIGVLEDGMVPLLATLTVMCQKNPNIILQI